MTTFLVVVYLIVVWILAIITYRCRDSSIAVLATLTTPFWPLVLTLWVLFLVIIYLPSKVIDYILSKFSKAKQN